MTTKIKEFDRLSKKSGKAFSGKYTKVKRYYSLAADSASQCEMLTETLRNECILLIELLEKERKMILSRTDERIQKLLDILELERKISLAHAQNVQEKGLEQEDKLL